MADENITKATEAAPPSDWHKADAHIEEEVFDLFEDHVFHVKHPKRGVSAVKGLRRAREAVLQPGFEPATEAEFHKHIGFKRGK